jgi:LysM repeat protein
MKSLCFHQYFPSHDPSVITQPMNPIKVLLPSTVALVLASCANNKNEYDTNNPYGTADAPANSAPYQPVAPANQTYDTPAAYEDAGNANAAAPNVNAPAAPAPATDPATSGGGTASVHTVVKGDSLWAISKKYKVSVDSIKRANNMTKDTVVLGSKLNIPAN